MAAALRDNFFEQVSNFCAKNEFVKKITDQRLAHKLP
jgi:hypothetical protein